MSHLHVWSPRVGCVLEHDDFWLSAAAAPFLFDGKSSFGVPGGLAVKKKGRAQKKKKLAGHIAVAVCRAPISELRTPGAAFPLPATTMWEM